MGAQDDTNFSQATLPTDELKEKYGRMVDDGVDDQAAWDEFYDEVHKAVDKMSHAKLYATLGFNVFAENTFSRPFFGHHESCHQSSFFLKG